jgi:hypothetical protein
MKGVTFALLGCLLSHHKAVPPTSATITTTTTIAMISHEGIIVWQNVFFF